MCLVLLAPVCIILLTRCSPARMCLVLLAPVCIILLTRCSPARMCLVLLAPVCIILLTRCSPATSGQSLTNAIHRTQAATERVNDLWCYECDTTDHGEKHCVDVATHNSSTFMKKCTGEEFICMVKRFSYTTSTENSTSSPKMWSLDRRCAINCEAGCIVIGERTKLYACTSCCEKSLCNVGRGGATRHQSHPRTGVGILREGLIILGLLGGIKTYHRRLIL